jgi:hypothetical protein
MSRGDPHWSEPKWVRASVRHDGNHLGSVTTVGYPNRDLTAFPEGSPYFEIVVADLTERHVALLQRFKQHWLIHCGDTYATTRVGGELNDNQIAALAVFGLVRQNEPPAALSAALEAQVESMLTPPTEQPN